MDYGRFLSASWDNVQGKNTLNGQGCTANKGIAIKLGNNEGAMLFDTDLCRWAGGWTGGFSEDMDADPVVAVSCITFDQPVGRTIIQGRPAVTQVNTNEGKPEVAVGLGVGPVGSPAAMAGVGCHPTTARAR